MNFWDNLKSKVKTSGNPFFALAPMADVTDVAFRQIITKYGRPEVLWTEFVSADGLMSEGREVLKKDLEFTPGEKPIVAQLFSSNPVNMRAAAKLCAEMGFDGIDINMGCPDKSIEKQGCGSAMIKTPNVAGEVILAAKQGVMDAGKDIPVSVKTRVGYNKPEIETWIKFLLEQNLAALSVHARTRRDLSKVPANWEYIKQIVKMRDQIAPNTLIIGNGDVTDVADGIKKANETGCDGIMVGRAIFGNPWLFVQEKSFNKNRFDWFYKIRARILPNYKNKYWLRTKTNVSIENKLNVMVEHAYLFEELLGKYKNFAVMKKHFKAYANGFAGAKDLRIQLMDGANNATETDQIVQNFLKNIGT